MGKSRIPPGFLYERQPPPEWERQLAELAPENEIHPWLKLAWLPGEWWEPIQRWCVYEMIPLRVWWGIIQGHRKQGKMPSEIMEMEILRALEGPHPRTLGGYDEVLKKFVTTAEVTKQQWELHKAHKAVPLLFWIIQGEKGGHKRTFTPIEQKYLRMLGLPDEPPLPGDLPYAPFDQRVLAQLARRDRLHAAKRSVVTGNKGIMDERDPEMVQFRRAFIGYLTDQVTEQLESYLLNINDLPKSSAKEDDPTARIEQAIENFIQTGSTTIRAED